MKEKILDELATMRSYLFIVLLLAAFVVLAIVIPAFSVLRRERRLRETSEFSSFGQVLLQKGELDKLKALCSARIKSYPEDVNAYFLKGVVHYRREEWGEALSCYREVDRLQPGTGAQQSILEIEEKMRMLPRSPDLKLVPPVGVTGSLDGPGGIGA